MCALFGWLYYKHIIPYKVLKKLTQTLANAAEERGTDAAGISYIKDGKVTIYKRPKPAHKIRFNSPDGTTAIMGHTRLTTQGNQKFNFNNHPFMVVQIKSSLLHITEFCIMTLNFAKKKIFLILILKPTATLQYSLSNSRENWTVIV